MRSAKVSPSMAGESTSWLALDPASIADSAKAARQSSGSNLGRSPVPAHPRVITATVIALRRAWTTAERNQARPPAGRWSGYRSDNFVIESFFATLESELLHRHRVRTRTAASLAVFHHLEGFYSPRRATRPWGASAQRTTKGATSPGYASTKPGHRLRERCLQIREGVLDAFASRSVLKTPGPVRAGVPVIALQAAAQAGTPESCVGPNLMKGCCCNPKPSGNTGTAVWPVRRADRNWVTEPGNSNQSSVR